MMEWWRWNYVLWPGCSQLKVQLAGTKANRVHMPTNTLDHILGTQKGGQTGLAIWETEAVHVCVCDGVFPHSPRSQYPAVPAPLSTGAPPPRAQQSFVPDNSSRPIYKLWRNSEQHDVTNRGSAMHQPPITPHTQSILSPALSWGHYSQEREADKLFSFFTGALQDPEEIVHHPGEKSAAFC